MTRAMQTDRQGPDPGRDSHVRPRVLVVDDSAMQRRVLAATLSRWDYDVTEAESAEAALTICQTAPPDIVISDWMMPGMSGPEFCRVFRDMPKAQYGYFILLTSKADKVDVALGLGSGADDFLTKPVNSGELRARLTAGERIHDMHRELTLKNRVIEETLGELQGLYDSIDADLVEAKKLQQSLIRERRVDFGPAQVSQILKSANRVGGDLVGHYRVGPDRIAIFSLDVSGHGISSALMTARLAGFLSSSVPNQNIGLISRGGAFHAAVPPDRIAAQLNDIVLRDLGSTHYFTLALAEVDFRSGHVRLVQAGHPHPMIQRSTGGIDVIGGGGFPVGLVEQAQFDLVEDRLNPGDRLLLMSDGVTECLDESGTMMTEEEVIRLIADLRGSEGTGFLESLVWSLSQRRGEARFDDDISAILLEYPG
ncbi:fused response regulator/phosphatase [Primorskyibacter flagellatus]|uniref:Fused response regulator/phosphatase n=2 Tax=Primorskyibacter flagellatus TaxID=1387277 RepID=A0A917AEL5_9RHOB|nr:fused response regulator/phosphatase [Primorskyibacter flagellatus]